MRKGDEKTVRVQEGLRKLKGFFNDTQTAFEIKFSYAGNTLNNSGRKWKMQWESASD